MEDIPDKIRGIQGIIMNANLFTKNDKDYI